MKLLNRQDLRSIGIRWSRQHIDRLIKASEFPQPVKIGQNTRVWIESEIDHWIKQRAAAREREPTAAVTSGPEAQ